VTIPARKEAASLERRLYFIAHAGRLCPLR
jgi:hypothetical protein